MATQQDVEQDVAEFLATLGLSTADVYGEGFHAGYHPESGEEQWLDWSTVLPGEDGDQVLLRVKCGLDRWGAVAELPMTAEDMTGWFASMGLTIIDNSDIPFMSEAEFLGGLGLERDDHIDGHIYTVSDLPPNGWGGQIEFTNVGFTPAPGMFRRLYVINPTQGTEGEYAFVELTAEQFVLLFASLGVWVFRNWMVG